MARQFVEGAEFADHCPTVSGNSTADEFLGCSDGDGDGIADQYDEVNGTIPQDSDSDGVVDSEDLCEGTEEGATVDENGCEIQLNLKKNRQIQKAKNQNHSLNLLSGDRDTVTTTVGFGAILLAILAILQTNMVAAMLPEAFKWVQVLGVHTS